MSDLKISGVSEGTTKITLSNGSAKVTIDVDVIINEETPTEPELPEDGEEVIP